MPLLSYSLGCQTYRNARARTSLNVFDFLVPSLHRSPTHASSRSRRSSTSSRTSGPRQWRPTSVEARFFSALSSASTCRACARPKASRPERTSDYPRRPLATTGRKRSPDLLRWHGDSPLPYDEREPPTSNSRPDPGGGTNQSEHTSGRRQCSPGERGFFNSDVKHLSELSHLPRDFFDDVAKLQASKEISTSEDDGWDTNKTWPMMDTESEDILQKAVALPEQLKLLSAVRELEEKLACARQNLQSSMLVNDVPRVGSPAKQEKVDHSMTLTQEDYKGLVDLYYHTYKSRFTPEAPDYSPTPTFLDDYSFKLSEDFAGPEAFARYYEGEEGYESPLKDVERILKASRLREISVMQKFVELLVDDTSSSRTLFEVYQRLPAPELHTCRPVSFESFYNGCLHLP